jgi:hypothetical protein
MNNHAMTLAASYLREPLAREVKKIDLADSQLLVYQGYRLPLTRCTVMIASGEHSFVANTDVESFRRFIKRAKLQVDDVELAKSVVQNSLPWGWRIVTSENARTFKPDASVTVFEPRCVDRTFEFLCADHGYGVLRRITFDESGELVVSQIGTCAQIEIA